MREENNRITVAFDRERHQPAEQSDQDRRTRRHSRRPGLRRRERRACRAGQPAGGQGRRPRAGVVYSITDKTVVARAATDSSGRRGTIRRPTTPTTVSSASRASRRFNRTPSCRSRRSTTRFPAGSTQPDGSSLGLLAGVGGTIDFVDQDKGTSRVQQYSIDVQRELPGNMAVSIGVHRRQGRLPRASAGPPTPSSTSTSWSRRYFALGSQLVQLVPNPFFGVAGRRPAGDPGRRFSAGSCCARFRSS